VNLFQCGGRQKIWWLVVFWTRSRAALRAAFPERQIFIRTDGRVRFFVFGPLLQIIMAGFTLLLLSWVVSTSINVTAQDLVITTQHYRLRQVQTLYDARNAAIDRFEAQQNTLAAIIERKEEVESALRFGSGPSSADSAPAAASRAMEGEADESTGGATDSGEPVGAVEPPGLGGSSHPLRSPAGPGPPGAQPRHESLLQGAANQFAEFFRREPSVAIPVDDPIPPQLESQQSWLAVLKAKQLTLLRKLRQSLETDTKRFRQALQNIGFVPETFIARVNAATAVPSGSGGPLLPLPGSLTDIDDREYLAQLANAANSLDTLTNIVKGMSVVPWLRPLDVDYGTASGFGVRRDPFTKQLAFHSGLDLSGPRGSPVRATAPGIVIYAGRRGAYGNTVEIDHGYGIRTRYGHLRSILVQTGAMVERGMSVGTLGSTGRSTGPHVHYEVWYGNSPRDPQKFIQAGQSLLRD
jgi:murein DD-endopeptidase MepM/ murein hydrolase activator NlpD